MLAYHATNKENVASILRDGLQPYFGFVYMTPDINVAKKFGEVVFEIDVSKLKKKYLGSYREMLCDILKTEDFIHYGDNIPTKLLKVIPKGI